MKIKQKIIIFALVVISSLGVGTLATQTTYAEPASTAGGGQATAGKCGEAKTAIISCNAGSGKSAKDSAIWQVLLVILNILTAGIGILGVGGIVYGSILYASASDKAEQTKKAIEIITNVVIGIVAYGLMYLVLNFLIPGGVFT
jgi:hypothetical protein